MGGGVGFPYLRERTVGNALVAARVLDPHSKLATSRSWGTTTFPLLLGLEEVTAYER